jgi:hypothetical protein
VFEGRPLVTTHAGMIGLPARHALHNLADASAVAACLPGLAADQDARTELGAASVACAAIYGAEVRVAAQGLWRSIRGSARPSRRPG